MPERGIDAVVFDFDGVLARSIQAHAVAYQLTLRPFGVPVDARDVYLREGARSETIIRSFMEEAGLEPDEALVERLASLKQQIFERIGAPELFAWAREVVETVDERGFRTAICTGTHRDNVPAIAGDLVDRFDAIAAEDAYTHDKPHPEAFQTAAELLDVPPERCLAVENAPRGIESAKKAGMFVVAVATTVDPDELTEADVVLESVPDVLDVIPDEPGQPPRVPK